MFIKLLMRNIQMASRMVRSLALRPFVFLRYKIYNLTNISKFLNKLPQLFASLLTKIKLKPEKRKDFVDAGSVYIAKSLLVILALILIAIPVLIVYYGWPWFVSAFLTAKICTGDPKLENYNGKVQIYHEQKLESLMFVGRLENGKYVGFGKEFDLNGRQTYAGNYVDGKHDGSGELLIADGTIYKGEFSKGKRVGYGQIFELDSLTFEGTFAEDHLEGDGTEYHRNGKEKYKGGFQGGLYSGKGVLYDENGVRIYEGAFDKGHFNGEGRYYDEKEELMYLGSFLNGLYDGKGKLFIIPNSMWYEGSFLAGKANGDGKLLKGGLVFYEGGFSDNMMAGTGVLTDIVSGLSYSGPFENNDIAYGKLFNLPVEDIYTAFSKGLVEDTSQEDYFYLYNQGFGLVLKLTYANDTEKAKLVAAYRLSQGESDIIILGKDDLQLPGSYKSGEEGTGLPAEDATFLLGIQQNRMKYYQAIYEGYGVCCWTVPKTGEVALLEYYPVEQPQNKGQAGKVDNSGVKAAADQPVRDYQPYFKDLGLPISDFGSLGYSE
ncbi:MAG: hypothetical protein PHU78_05570 [Heliobacteriaceae bacterium]|nr:hypothetical protein [Heliobacteriaceae bacterium]